MVSFGLDVKKPEAYPVIMDIRENLLVDNLLKNPFNAKVTFHGNDFFTVIMEPVYPRVYLGSIFAFFSAILFSSVPVVHNIMFVIGLVMLSMYVFWWDKFYFALFYLKTKRGVRYVSASEALSRVV